MTNVECLVKSHFRYPGYLLRKSTQVDNDPFSGNNSSYGSVVPGGTSSGANTVLRWMEAFMGRNDPMMHQPRSDSQPAEDKTTRS